MWWALAAGAALVVVLVLLLLLVRVVFGERRPPDFVPEVRCARGHVCRLSVGADARRGRTAPSWTR